MPPTSVCVVLPHAKSEIAIKSVGHLRYDRCWGLKVCGFIMSGAAGFIGSHLCDRLVEEGHRVAAYDNFRKSITGDVLATRAPER